ncbi:MAG: hypothetical protein JKX91_09545 [Rhizobiaceae bacterium]|nr:hypothetical protein [Rhizobiaceae bacterium]
MGVFRNLAMAGAVSFATIVSSPAYAAMWSINSVDNGIFSGFGASGFHNTGNTGADNDDNVMTGSSLGSITGTAGGFFNDATGEFSGIFLLDGNPSFALSSDDLFFGTASGGTGFLDGPSTMTLNLAGLGGTMIQGLTTTNIGFLGMDVCCGAGATDPNSFNITGGGLTAVMALWGANGFFDTGYSGYDDNPGTTIEHSSIGMDLRLQFTLIPELPPEVPIPASLPLFGTGLALMGYLGWRKKRKA